MLQLRVRTRSRHPMGQLAHGTSAFEHHPLTDGYMGCCSGRRVSAVLKTPLMHDTNICSVGILQTIRSHVIRFDTIESYVRASPSAGARQVMRKASTSSPDAHTRATRLVAMVRLIAVPLRLDLGYMTWTCKNQMIIKHVMHICQEHCVFKLCISIQCILIQSLHARTLPLTPPLRKLLCRKLVTLTSACSGRNYNFRCINVAC